MRAKVRLIVLLVLLGLASAFAYAARRASLDRVTLDVDGADLAQVVRKLEWQTWERIHVSPGLTRKITLKVEDVPLARALEAIAAQAECEWRALYPIYRDQPSLRTLLLKIEQNPSSSLWTNYAPHRPRPPSGAGPLESEAAADIPINYQAQNRPAWKAAQELNRLADEEMVLEDSVRDAVNLEFREATVAQVASGLARAVGRRHTRLYVLRPFFREPGQPGSAPAPSREVVMQSLPGDLRKAFESGQPVQIKFEPGRGAPPPVEPVRDFVARPPLDPAEAQRKLQERLRENLRNSTPEQRLERLRQAQQPMPRPPFGEGARP